ncbi:hypothetical protein EGW08_006291 [Elysia chlorotica]|uniref:Uncharacterized protein n=1 Tax=Elysia chlorotica TaxID=188477 RepID=A0A3S0ZSW8_ELYCH|nr:hypothetical protein EGW08_006291 [Elysia chlorotica]
MAGLTVISKGYKPNETFKDDEGDGAGGDPSLSQSPPCYYAVIQRRKPEVTATSSDDSGVTVVSTTPSRDPAFRRSFPASHSSSSETHFPSTAQVISGAKSSSAIPTEAATLQRRAANSSTESQPAVAGRGGAGTEPSSSSSRGSNSTMLNKSASAPSSGTATPIRRGGSSSLRHGEAVRPSSAVSDMAHQRSSAATCIGSNNSPKHVQISDIVSVNITGDCLPAGNNYPGPNPNVDKPNGILKRDNSFRRDREPPPLPPPLADVPPSMANDNVFPNVLPQVQTSFVAGDDNEVDRESSSTPPPPPPPPAPANDENLDKPLKSSPSRKNNTLRVDCSKATSTLHPNQHKTSSSSESPEWPSPPEPLTPQTPQTPNAGATAHMSFDSDTIQRMLRSLPDSPLDIYTSDNFDQGFHEEDLDPSGYSRTLPNPRFQGGQPNHGRDPSSFQTADSRQEQPVPDPSIVQAEKRGSAGSRLFRTKSLTVHDRQSKSETNRRQQSVDTPSASAAAAATSGKVDPASHRRRMFNKIALEKELKKRNRNIAANYPDSGIGMGPGEGATSLRSDTKTGEFLAVQ